MKYSKEEFCSAVLEGLPSYVDAETVKKELQIHIEEAATDYEEEGMMPEEALTRAIENLGNPWEIASGYKEAKPLFIGKITVVLFMLNSLFFLAGIIFLYFQSWLAPGAKEKTWWFINENKVLLLLLYALFWLFIGIHFGRQYGFKVRKVLPLLIQKPLLLNYVFMLAVLFRIIPPAWFNRILSMDFILLCVAVTLLFTRIAALGWKWGASHMGLE